MYEHEREQVNHEPIEEAAAPPPVDAPVEEAEVLSPVDAPVGETEVLSSVDVPVEEAVVPSPMDTPVEAAAPLSAPIPGEEAAVLPPVSTPIEADLPKKQKKQRKRMSPGFKLAMATGFAVLLIMAVSALAYLFTAYEVRLSSDSGGLHIWLTPREQEERRIEETPGLTPRPPAEGESEPDQIDLPVPTPAVTLGSGFTLELLPRPEESEDGGSPRLSFQEIYQKCSASVVLIEVQFERIFGMGGGTGSGTGIVLTEDGLIVTSAHVIEDARQISVVLYDGTRHIAALVGMDENTDIAVLQIDATGLIPAVFGDSDELQIGEEVAVIGNPLGQHNSMSNGIISALNRDITYGGMTMRMIQTNAAINQGNSGGPLINLYGQVVGITNMKFIGQAVEGMGFAIPTTTLAPVVDELIAHGRIVGRASIGIVVQTVDNWAALTEGIEPGVYVERVLEETDAFQRGLQVGDRIVYANDAPVMTALDLRAEIQRFRAGDMIRLTIERDGREMILEVRLMDVDLLEF